jgi:integrase
MLKAFTDKLISNLKPKGTKYYMREGRGFAIQVLPSGSKTFMYIYTFRGRRRHLNLGIYPVTTLAEARQKYMDAAILVGRGKDPHGENVIAVPEENASDEILDGEMKVSKLAELYLECSKQHHTLSWHVTNRMSLNNDVLPFWGEKPINTIRRRDAIALIEKVAGRAPGQARNVLKAARSMFDYALQREYIDASPFTKISRAVPSVRPKGRERTLSDAEIKEAWEKITAGPGSEITKRALKLILITAQRPSEVSGLHRSEIKDEWWTIPPGRAKNGQEHRVYLSQTALNLIGDTKGYIFPSPREVKPIGSSLSDSKPIGRNALAQLVSSKMEKIIEGKKKKKEITKLPYYGMTPWTPHDLRRTARTVMARIGIPDEYAEEVLNHSKVGIKKVYNTY